MSDPAREHAEIAGRFLEVAREASPADWESPSPVDGWTARDVVGHLVEWFADFLSSGAGVDLPEVKVAEDPVGAWATRTADIQALLEDGRIPVVSSIARAEDDGHVYNVNADTAAAALAAALGAETLMVLTDVEGLYEDWPNSDEVISRLTAAQLEKLLPELSSGMVPKMEGCLHAVRNGVHTARVIDGRVQHSILLEIFTDEGIGTMVVPDENAGDKE